VSDTEFVDAVADRLHALRGVVAVSLGGSRAAGTARPDSDWDLAVYYHGEFDPAQLRAIGWPGTVFGVGEWGGGVFNGGAWLEIDGRRVDVHYRDLQRVNHELGESVAGRFAIEPLAFHLAGIPTYILTAELAGNAVVRGALPRPAEYPVALRRAAPGVWWSRAEEALGYARTAHAPAGRATPCLGLLAQAALQAAHAVAAARGVWVTNEKTLWDHAAIPGVDAALASPGRDPEALTTVVDEVAARCAAARKASPVP
jgi:Nucleotidyltransferase domain